MSDEILAKTASDIFGQLTAAQIVAASLALTETRRNGISVIIVLIISTSARTGWLLYADRLSTTLRAVGDATAAQQLAFSGFFVEESGDSRRQRAVCFCCEAEQDASSPPESSVHRPDCLVARLVHLAEQPPTSAEWATTGDAAVRQHLNALRRLQLLLDSPVVGAAASYGFEPAFLRQCLAKQFLRPTAGGLPTNRPGDLLRLAQTVLDADPRALTVAPRFDIRRLIDSCSTDSGAAAALQPPPRAPPPQPSLFGSNSGVVLDGFSVDAFSMPSRAVGGGTFDGVGDDEADDRCIRCRSRTRNRVTLPCAHFLLCDRCLEPLSRCPRCNSNIAASVTAFIT